MFHSPTNKRNTSQGRLSHMIYIFVLDIMRIVYKVQHLIKNNK